jgi:hypothetical protein
MTRLPDDPEYQRAAPALVPRDRRPAGSPSDGCFPVHWSLERPKRFNAHGHGWTVTGGRIAPQASGLRPIQSFSGRGGSSAVNSFKRREWSFETASLDFQTAALCAAAHAPRFSYRLAIRSAPHSFGKTTIGICHRFGLVTLEFSGICPALGNTRWGTALPQPGAFEISWSALL